MSAELVRASKSSTPSGSSTPRSKLDALSREDLIRFVKKQVENLKILKAENANLTEQNTITTKAFQDAEEEWRRELNDANDNLRKNEREIVSLTEERDSLIEANGELSAQIKQLNDELAEYKLSSRLASNVNKSEKTRELESETWKPLSVNTDESSNQKEEDEVRLREQLNEMNETVREHLNEMKTLKDMFREETEKLRKAEKRNEELQCTVDELRSSLDDTNEQLNVIKEKRNAENVFSLEIADYEKSLEKVQKELKMTKDDCASLNAELELARSEANTIRDEKQAISQKFTKMKSAVVKLKAELDEKKDIINGLETDKRSMEETIKKLTDNRTDEKMEFSAAIAAADEKTRQLETTCVSLNKQLVSLRSQRESLQRQYDDLVQEHTTFKTRALYVLEQKKGSDDGEPSNKDEIEQLEQTIQQQTKTIENLTHTQRATHEELCSVREHSLALSVQLREVERQLKSSNETHKSKLSEQRNEFESRLAVESKLNGELMAQIDANFMAHSQEKERILADAERDREKLNDEIDTLRRSLDAEIKRRKEAEKNKSPANIVLAPRQRKESGVFEVNSSFLQRPKSSVDETTHANRNNIEAAETGVERTLEDVLNADDSDTMLTVIHDEWQSNAGDENVKDWEQIALNTHKQLEHTRELLNECEASNVRLSEQSKLLKEEIRRLERNEQRKDHMANSEYLKNVILKFIAPEKVSAERGQLIPVLATMLKLSTDEVNVLNRIAEADLVNENEAKSAGWSSYLHRWSGLS